MTKSTDYDRHRGLFRAMPKRLAWGIGGFLLGMIAWNFAGAVNKAGGVAGASATSSASASYGRSLVGRLAESQSAPAKDEAFVAQDKIEAAKQRARNCTALILDRERGVTIAGACQPVFEEKVPQGPLMDFPIRTAGRADFGL